MADDYQYVGPTGADDNRSVLIWEKRDGQGRLVHDQCSLSEPGTGGTP